MAVNAERSMKAELDQGLRDGGYIHLSPDWSVNANPPVERLSWPTYAQAEQHARDGLTQIIGPITPREPGPQGQYTVPEGGHIVPGL